jgi:hypothetical protein
MSSNLKDRMAVNSQHTRTARTTFVFALTKFITLVTKQRGTGTTDCGLALRRAFG